MNWKQSNGCNRGATNGTDQPGHCEPALLYSSGGMSLQILSAAALPVLSLRRGLPAGGEYLRTQLLGIDLRAVEYPATQGCEHRAPDKANAADRKRIACMDQYARFLTDMAEAAFGPMLAPGI